MVHNKAKLKRRIHVAYHKILWYVMVAVEIILIPILFLLTFRFFQNANVLLIYACAVSVILYLLIVNGFKRIVTAIVYRSLQVYDAQL